MLKGLSQIQIRNTPNLTKQLFLIQIKCLHSRYSQNMPPNLHIAKKTLALALFTCTAVTHRIHIKLFIVVTFENKVANSLPLQFLRTKLQILSSIQLLRIN